MKHELFTVEAVIFLRVPVKEAAAQNSLGRVLPLLVIQAVDAPEIGYAALGVMLLGKADTYLVEKGRILFNDIFLIANGRPDRQVGLKRFY